MMLGLSGFLQLLRLVHILFEVFFISFSDSFLVLICSLSLSFFSRTSPAHFHQNFPLRCLNRSRSFKPKSEKKKNYKKVDGIIFCCGRKKFLRKSVFLRSLCRGKREEKKIIINKNANLLEFYLFYK